MRQRIRALRPSMPVLLAASLLASGCLLATTAPAQAQRGSGVYDRPYDSNIFNPLLRGRYSVLFQVTGEAANNVLDVGDAVAIMRIADDDENGLKPSDILLIGGLVPAGHGLHLDGRAAFDLTLGIVPTRFGILGINAGARVHAEGSMPDELAGLLRDGFEGDSVTVDFSELFGAGLAYAHAGVLAIAEVPLAGLLPLPELRLRAGLGLRRIFGIAHVAFDFKDEGRGSSVFFDHDGIDTEITMLMPLEVAQPGGGGFAADIFAAADIGQALHVNVLLSNLGSMDIEVAERQSVRIDVSRGGLSEFLEQLDSLTVTDTLPATTESVSLPALFRMEAGYQLNRKVGLGVIFEKGIGDRFAAPSHIGALAELRPLRWLPIRLGASIVGEGYGAGMHGGFGLHLGAMRWDLDIGSRGAGRFDRAKGAALRTSFGLQF